MRRLGGIAVISCLAASLSQGSITYTATGNIMGDAVDASATFSISNCTLLGCQLDVILNNAVSDPTNAAFGVIGVSFDVDSLTIPGTLLVNGSNVAEVTDGNGNQV